MKVLLSGSTGLIGSALSTHLKNKGYQVFSLTRDIEQKDDNFIYWNPQKKELNLKDFEGFETIIHLAGENVGTGGRWNEKKRKQIRESRVVATQVLSDTLTQLEHPPKLFICASAIGYYGERGNTAITENSPPGGGFLSNVCSEWESATKSAQEKGIRVINTRIGVVLSPNGGALKQMLLPFRLGLGGALGSGKQFMSWVALDDVINAFYFLMKHESIQGPVNLVSPKAVTNKKFTLALGKTLHRPTIFTVPEFMIKLIFGKKGEELLLSSQNVKPETLLKEGFQFQYPDIEKALHHLLK